MPFSRTVSLLVTLCFFFSVGRAALADSSQREASPAARVVSVNGRALAGKRALKPGDALFAGMEIHTMDRSGVKLLLADRSIVDIGPSAVFLLNKVKSASDGSRDVDLTLDHGTVRSSVTKKLDRKSHFFIRTKSSVLAIRGTELVTSWEETSREVKQQVTVSEGKIELIPAGAQKPVEIAAGQQNTLVGTFEKDRFVPLKSGALGTTVTLSRSDAASVVNGARVTDETFQSNVVVGPRDAFHPSVEGPVTLGTLASAVSLSRESRAPANVVEPTQIPVAVGQDIANGSSQIPGFSGIPGTTLPGPTLPATSAPQLPVNIDVILVPRT